MIEPGLGAFATVILTFLIGLFTPVQFLRFSLDRLLVGGSFACLVAVLGSDAGERLAARLGNRASRLYARSDPSSVPPVVGIRESSSFLR